MGQWLAVRVFGGFFVVGYPVAGALPGAWAHLGHIVDGEHFQRPHLRDARELLQRGQDGDFQSQVVALACHFHKVLQDGFHGNGNGNGGW